MKPRPGHTPSPAILYDGPSSLVKGTRVYEYVSM